MAQTSVELAWNPSTSGNPASYAIHYGTGSRSYSGMVPVGNTLSGIVNGLFAGQTYYFAVTASNAEGYPSPYSEELVLSIPGSDAPADTMPSVELASPVSGATFAAPASIPLEARVYADGYAIATVQYFQGSTLLGEVDTAPYTFSWAGVPAGSYAVSTMVVFVSGDTIVSPEVPITVAAASQLPAPTISLSTPVAGATFTAPASIALAASVTANGNTISRVQFFNGSTLLGEDPTAPFAYTWGSVPAGSYSLSARVLYGSGASVSTPARTVTVSSTSTAPTIAFSSPAVGASFTAPASITLAANVTANGNTISRVQFFNGSTLLSEDFTSPFAYTWNSVAAGTYSLTARVLYGSGKSVTTATRTVSVKYPAPTIALTSPAVGASFNAPASITFAASVTPNGNTITKVQFFNGATFKGEDTTAPYTYTWSSVAAGSYNLSARAVYGSGSSVSSATRTVSVAASKTAPTIALTSPAVGATFSAPASITFAASVTPNGNTISKVQFFNGATLKGEDTTAPYTYTWNSVATGSYNLSARAVYGSGSSVSSASRTVSVGSSAPVVTLTAPASGASFTAPATFTLTASVVANGNTLSRVQFFNGTNLLTEDFTSPFAYTWGSVAAGTYPLSARVIYGSGSTASSPVTTVQVSGVPAPWESLDIGDVGTASGSASLANGLVTVSGSGLLGGSTDSFTFLYQSLSGDGSIETRLNSLQDTGPDARVGIMIRESLTAGSRHVFLGLSPDGQIGHVIRSATGDIAANAFAIVNPTSVQATATPPNVWLRLVRTGDTISAFYSTDGTTWTGEATDTLPMAANIQIGIAVASGSPPTLNSSTLSEVVVIP